MIRPGDELVAELLWDDDGPGLRTPTPFFQPFTCSAAGSSSARELGKRHPTPMDDDVLGLGAGHDDAVPWLHCPVVDDDGDSDGTAPLPPEYCAGLFSSSGSGYSSSGLHAVPDPTPAPSQGVVARPSSHVAVPAARAVPPPDTAPAQGVMNFTFFSRPLHRPAPSAAAAVSPLESTVVQTAASRLRSTPLFSEQRMARLQPPPNKAPPPRATTAVPAPPPAPPHPASATTYHHHRHHDAEAAAATVTQQQQHGAQQLQAPDARRAPHEATAVTTTSSVCSGNGDHRSHTTRTSEHHHQQHTAECSVSPDEDMDDEPAGAARRAAARGTKRSRTAEVHNLSERRRRDRINEKMRALQELIPNCNKIDKASMLEEAIEYLKTLQLQVQMMMSMGTAGMCVPPPAMLMQMQVPPFPHLGAMGLGYPGMPAFDMLPRFAAQFPVMPAGAPPHGAMFGMMPGHVMPPVPFATHVNGAAPADQREAAAGVPAPPPGDHPPAAVASQVDQQHPEQT